MTGFRVESTRGGLVESVHHVSVAVTDAEGRLVASAGDPDLVTYWRSAAKPFQALPVVADGAADAFGLDDEEIALACASHSSEPVHLDVASRFLEKIGCTEDDLACGPHTPLGHGVAERVARSGERLTPRWSNCSGKHAGMLALAKHRRWSTDGYERAGHPVQDRLLAEVSRWTGVAAPSIGLAVDGCTTVCYALPLRAMATSYARLARSAEPAAARIREAMRRHPRIVAGTARLCTDLGLAWPDGIIAKVGADGVYSAALLQSGHGIALKVGDGEMRAAQVALLGVLRQTLAAIGGDAGPLERLALRAEPPIRNTRREATGVMRAAGSLAFVG
jgi:L-asparaginase II